MINILSIFTSPRVTMRTLLDAESRRAYYILPAIMGLLSAPTVALSIQALLDGHDMKIWIGAIVLSVLSYGMYVSVYGMVYRLIGGWLGGTGTNADVQLALAWTQVPYIVIGLVYLPIQLMYREQLYPEVDFQSIASLTTAFQNSSGIYWIGPVFFVPKLVAYFISLKLLGEACRFSVWKAFGVKIIAVLLHIPFLFVAGLIAVPLSIADFGLSPLLRS